jgi:hypothetical protein
LTAAKLYGLLVLIRSHTSNEDELAASSVLDYAQQKWKGRRCSACPEKTKTA